MAEEVPTTALRTRAGELTTRASMGEVITLTKHGRPVAIIGPLTGTFNPTTGSVATTSSSLGETSSTGTQMSPTDASHPSRRPAAEAEPQRAKSGADAANARQAQRDALLRPTRTPRR